MGSNIRFSDKTFKVIRNQAIQVFFLLIQLRVGALRQIKFTAVLMSKIIMKFNLSN
jgi:hypothetical protein